MKEIGGFLSLELNEGKHFHLNSVKLNLGRSCLKYIIRVKNISKIYIPYYSCDSIVSSLEDENADYEYYHIDEKLNPIFSNELKKNEYLLYINYFGLKDDEVKNISNSYKNIIIDNTQAFFSEHLEKTTTFYSLRKFFGVPDGGYLYLDDNRRIDNLKIDFSYKRFKHLLLRIDKNAQAAYQYYKENEEMLNSLEIKRMSRLTNSLLSSINYEKVSKIRNDNFKFLNNKLGFANQIDLNLNKKVNGPLIYPFLCESNRLKSKLIENNIYIPTYWKEVLNRTKKNDFGNYLTRNLMVLPIDQRYDKNDMKLIVDLVLDLINEK